MTEKEIYQLHLKYTHGKYKDKILEIVWNHSLIVKEIALQIAEKLKNNYGIETDKNLIEEGSLLHDIGNYGCFDDDYKKICQYVLHGKMGYDILIQESLSKKLARFALVHVGVGICQEQIEKDQIDLPKENLIPITLEEEIVCYADSFHSKGHPGFNNYQETYEELDKHGYNYQGVFKRFEEKFGIPNLDDLKNKYENWHIEINKWLNTIRI